MRPAWPAMIGAAAALAAAGPCALAEPVPAPPAIEQEATAQVAPAGADAGSGAAASDTWAGVSAWIRDSYERAPALVLGLAVLLALPPLAVLGLLVRRRAPASPDATHIHSRDRAAGKRESGLTRMSTEREPAWPSRAWIEIEGAEGSRQPINRAVVRVGRETDNDICLTDKTVHRYHAAIHRTEDAEFVITDLSSAGGNGVTVNGRRLSEKRLEDGDLIELGLARMRFVAKPA